MSTICIKGPQVEYSIETSESEVTKSDGVIVLKDLVKSFGNHLVLNGVSLAIERGKSTVIIGPSGCGKTVLVKHLIVLERPTSGQVYFNEQRVDELSESELLKVRTNYGFLFQGGALFDSLSVAENIMFPILQHRRVTDMRKAYEVVTSRLALVGLDGFQNFYPGNLSGGQQKRVALARAIALNPEVILYDEPTTGLDPIRSDIISELIVKLQRELGATTVVVTHDMKSAYKIADRIIMLHHGKIIADGDADHIRNHPHPIVQQFIHGEVGQDDLAVLRAGGTISQSQFLPSDFEE